MATSHIACVAFIGKKNSPLHLSTYSTQRDLLTYHFLMNTALDVFAARVPTKTNGDSEFGLLYAVDDGCALYGWLTNTGVKILVAVEGPVGEGGVREGDIKNVFRSLQTSYISVVCNPFFDNDETRPITSRRFVADVKRVAESWRPSVMV